MSERKTNTSDSELERLVANLLDGGLTDEKHDRLIALLETDEEARQTYAQLISLHAMLETELDPDLPDVTAQSISSGDDSAAMPRRTAGGSKLWGIVRYIDRPVPFSVAMATVTLAVILLLLAIFQIPFHQDPAPRPMLGGLYRPPARVTDVRDAVWDSESDVASQNASLNSGDEIILKSGQVEITFGEGVYVLLDGPARLRVDDLAAATLQHGRASVLVGPNACGFKLDTPAVEVVDLGTEFAVAIENRDAAEVLVFKGEVEVGAKRDGQVTHRQRFHTGQRAVVRSGAIEVGKASETKQEFARDYTQPKATILGVRASTGKPYRVVRHGLHEDVSAYIDRKHEWNGVDSSGLPPQLVAADYIQTANDDKSKIPITVEVELAGPAILYVFYDNRCPVPSWISSNFEDTGLDIGCDEASTKQKLGTGPGHSIDNRFSVFRKRVDRAGWHSLGAAVAPKENMYGVAAVAIPADEHPTKEQRKPAP